MISTALHKPIKDSDLEGYYAIQKEENVKKDEVEHEEVEKEDNIPELIKIKEKDQRKKIQLEQYRI